MNSPRSWIAFCVLSLSLILASSPAFAGAVLAADVHGGLWRLGAQTDSKIRVGTLPALLVGLELTPSGQLFGLEATGQVWMLDPRTAEGDVVSEPDSADAFEYRDLAETTPGELVLLRWDRQAQISELLRVRIIDGSRELIGSVTSTLGTPFFDPFDPHTLLASTATEVLLLDHSVFFNVGLNELIARQISDPVDFVAIADLSIDPESGTAWVLSERTEGEPGLELIGSEALTFQEVDDTKPRYRFPYGLGPRAIAFQPPTDVCSQDSGTLCLQEGRFNLRVDWADFDGNRGAGQVVVDRSDTAGQFWFFSEDNRELMVKVINACSFNSRFWVFLAGTTNIEFELTVTDIDTFNTKVYSNVLGATAETVLDTDAFSCSNSVDEGGL